MILTGLGCFCRRIFDPPIGRAAGHVLSGRAGKLPPRIIRISRIGGVVPLKGRERAQSLPLVAQDKSVAFDQIGKGAVCFDRVQGKVEPGQKALVVGIVF